MSPQTDFGRFRWMYLVLLGWMLAGMPAVILGQEGNPLPFVTAPHQTVSPSACSTQELLERLRKIEERLDQVSKQNENLLRENKVLAVKAEAPFGTSNNPGPQGVLPSTLP